MPFQEIVSGKLSDTNGSYEIFAPGERGLLLIRGPNIFLGYLREQQNTGVLLDDGWLNTGDIGLVDKDGFVFVLGREKDVIVVGGANVDAKSVEDLLISAGPIQEAAVVSFPSSRYGEVPVAFVELQDGAAIDFHSFRKKLKGKLPSYALPRKLVSLASLPRTTVGKIDKRELKFMAYEIAARDLLKKYDVKHFALERSNDEGEQRLTIFVSEGASQDSRLELSLEIGRWSGIVSVKLGSRAPLK
jgi:acyl-CoA synthetase (AMP-forming)/AMP-acid ligase II